MMESEDMEQRQSERMGAKLRRVYAVVASKPCIPYYSDIREHSFGIHRR